MQCVIGRLGSDPGRTRASRFATAVALSATLAACGAQKPPATAPHRPSRAERQLAADLDRVFGAPAMAQGLWGVEIKSLDSGRVLYALNPRKLMMPASNMKIVTLATAARSLGWDFRFTTTLETAAAIENGALTGDLIVRGSGDPTINSRDQRAAKVFDDWALALRGLGITRIDGNIVGDDNAFDDEGLGAGWAWDYLQYGYAAPVGALQYNEDVAALTISAGASPGAPAVAALASGAGLRLVNRAYTGEPASEVTIDYTRRLDAPVLEISGSIPAGAAPITRDVAVVNPTIFFAQALKDGLTARGIAVAGTAVDADDQMNLPAPATRRALVQTQSPPLRDIATTMMKVSENLYAETLLKASAAAKGGLGTTAGGRLVTRDVLAGWGIPDSSYIQVDGSGLSRYDYVTAEMLVGILEHAYREPALHDAFVATLPIAGRDGTMRSRLKNTRGEANATAKTGSIANVRTLSGYVRTRDGETLVFSMLANNFAIPSSTVTWIADLAVETLSNFTSRGGVQ
ncbi:MAG TPA: D-alanyl-D-alanine carboxypeptidase/D-alanyl-D-alanine-endopeptidase [Vicinamibacterales bacterium]|nr:D-alanyl-D-alanine carboxypeptidase/D-alanyl-D-alanine-endopeptidase [Vicinamibacterales bacterium]